MKKTCPTKLEGKRILVTGASGFIGSSLAAHMVKLGAVVGGMDRVKRTVPEMDEGAGCRFFECDLTNFEETRRGLEEFRPEILIHLAAHPDAGEELNQYHAAIRGNILATVNALEAFRACGGELFLYGDSCKVYGNTGVPYEEALPERPLSSYAIAKAAGWEYCKLFDRLHDIAAVSVRPTLIYGPGQGVNIISYIVNSVLDGHRRIKLDGGSQTRDPLYIQDALRAFTSIAQKGKDLRGRVINISGGFEISVADLARLIVGQMGGTALIESDPGRTRPTETLRSFCENREALEAVGWRPQTTLEEGLKQTVKHLSQLRLQSYSYFRENSLRGQNLDPSMQNV
ncbi:MAG: NAD(P)-dependent oxidoreductase [Acidobacteria bacterium]|nr:NAD(P)-dependent oxidoreductase [Acidobacteriota bacterium]